MGFHFFTSNHLPALAAKLAEDITSSNDIFARHTIITQTAGMNQWLRQQIALQKGIAANVDFLQPSDFVFKLHLLLRESKRPKLPKHNLEWLIYQALSEKDFQKQFPQQAAYYLIDNKINESKLWELASKLSDLFDQYQIYRYKTLKEWSAGQNNFPDFEWQFYIWNRVKVLAGEAFPEMSKMQEEIFASLNAHDKITLLQSRYPKVALFGFSIFTRFHMDIFRALAQHIDFYIYITNPAPDYYWMDDLSEKVLLKKNLEDRLPQGNNLLTSWGRLIQNSFKLLYEDEHLLNIQTEIDHQEPHRNTLLSKIQNDIFHNRFENIHFTADDLKDGSLKLVSVYNIQTEVESLYNFLLHISEQQLIPGLKENDILVVIPQIDKYAPYIKAVFDQAPYRFNYTIADERIAQTYTWANALLKIISLTETDFNAKTLSELFESSYIRKKFGLEDTEWINHSLKQSGFRFGLKNRRDDQTFLFAWQYAIQRLVLSYCIAGEHTIESKEKNPLLTIDNFETSNDLRHISALYDLGEKLAYLFSFQHKSLTLSEWQEFLEKITEDFLLINDDAEEEDLAKAIADINQLKLYIDSELELTIPYPVMVKRLRSRLQHSTQQKRFLSRGITFCSPQPYRSIPFKVIAFLGLNFDDFPRRDRLVKFDLIQYQPQPGDRSLRDNDRHLFLESLLAAKNIFYISYIGKDAQTNNPRPSSILVDELLDYIQSGMQQANIDVRETLVEQRPLHSFSIQYNKPNSNLIPNYLIKTPKEYPIRLQNEYTFAPLVEANIYTMRELVKSVTRGVEYFCQRTLGLYINNDFETLETEEVLKLNKLEQVVYSNEFIKALTHGEDESAFLQKLWLQGKLPINNLKDKEINKHLQPIKQLIQQALHNHKLIQSKDIEFKFQGTTISGTLDYVSEKCLLVFDPDDKKTISRTKAVEAFLLLAMGTVSGEIEELHYYHQSKTKIARLELVEAHSILQRLIQFAKEGEKRPHFVHISKDLKLVNDDAKMRAQIIKELIRHRDEYNNMYYKLAFNNFVDWLQDIIQDINHVSLNFLIPSSRYIG